MTRDHTCEMEVHFTESLSANCVIQYSQHGGEPASDDGPGEGPCVEVTSVKPVTVYVWLPLVGDVEITLSPQHLEKMGEYAMQSGSIQQYIETTIMEDDDESASN